jgi:glycosyltransferase involved in cell wall biosynthesis
MRIGIDYRPALLKESGIGRYTRELVRALAERAGPESFLLYGSLRRPHPRPPGLPGRFAWCGGVFPARLLFLMHRVAGVTVESRVGGLDVFHQTDFTFLPLARAARVATIHDLAFEEGRFHEPRAVAALGRVVRRAVAECALVLTVSEASARDLRERHALEPARVRVTPLGVDARFFEAPPAAALEEFRRRHALPARFILFVGTLEPRKNVDGLVRAFARLRAAAPDVALVIAGRRGWMFEGALRAAAPLGRAVRFLGHFPDAELPLLYRASAVFAYPSHAEGFGLPALEALASGVPVVTSRAPALLETVGEAAERVPAGDDEALAEALLRRLRDPGDAATAGPARARTFPWSRTAEATLRAYAEAGAAA